MLYYITYLRTYTELHREFTELHRVKKLNLCGSLWSSVELSVIESYFLLMGVNFVVKKNIYQNNSQYGQNE